jgi:predicted N-acetyltransferase YhbS
LIRPTRPADRDAIIGVVREAFSTGGRDGQEEVDIVLNTWLLDAAVSGLDLVAMEDREVVGHVLGAYDHLDERELVGVAPLAVDPRRQGEGIGSALMAEALAARVRASGLPSWPKHFRRAEEIGEPVVVRLGSPEYYSRLGFEPAGPLGIDYPPMGPGNRHFLVRKLASYNPDYRGEFKYCWEAASD